MICSPAQAHDFERWEAQAKKMDATQLWWSAQDCYQTAHNMELMDNPVRAGYYRDQGNTFMTELSRR